MNLDIFSKNELEETLDNLSDNADALEHFATGLTDSYTSELTADARELETIANKIKQLVYRAKGLLS